MRPSIRRVAVGAAGVSLLSTPVAAHGVTAAATGLGFPLVVAGVVGTSLVGGGLVLLASGWLPSSDRAVLPLLVFALGGVALALAVMRGVTVTLAGAVGGVGIVYLARDAAVTDCGTCADATLGAVLLHRGLEGVVLATVYAADAALGLLGAAVLAVHAAAETAAVGSLYAPTPRYAVAAVCLVQVGFVGGVTAGVGVVDGVSPGVEAGLLALVGGVLLAVGTRETWRRHTAGVGLPA